MIPTTTDTARKTITDAGGTVNLIDKQIRIKLPRSQWPYDLVKAVTYLSDTYDCAIDNSADKTCAICTEEIPFGEFVCTTCKLLDEN